MHLQAGQLVKGCPADVGPGVGAPASLDDQLRHQGALLVLGDLGDGDVRELVLVYAVPVLEPVHVVRDPSPLGGVALEVDGLPRVHVLLAFEGDGCDREWREAGFSMLLLLQL